MTRRDICYKYTGSNTPIINTDGCIFGDGTIGSPVNVRLSSIGNIICTPSGLAVSGITTSSAECGADDLGTSTIIDFSSGLKAKTTTLITDPTVLDFSGSPEKCWYTLEVVNGGNSDNTITWDSDILWSGTPPQPVVGASGTNPISIFQFWFDGTNYHGRQ
jgi:hypothetical protein